MAVASPKTDVSNSPKNDAAETQLAAVTPVQSLLPPGFGIGFKPTFNFPPRLAVSPTFNSPLRQSGLSPIATLNAQWNSIRPTNLGGGLGGLANKLSITQSTLGLGGSGPGGGLRGIDYCLVINMLVVVL